ncbi:MAG: VWA domain-containing protein [Patescibacteria group bacterium]
MKKILIFLATILLLASNAMAQTTTHDYVIVVLDGSGSMSGNMQTSARTSIVKMTAAKNALKSVLQNVTEKTKVGILAFTNGNIWWVWKTATVKSPDINTAIDRVNENGSTPLGEAIKAGADQLMFYREQQLGYGRFQLVIVTDGEANNTNYMDEVAKEVRERRIRMDVIGVAMPGGAKDSLAEISDSYQSADNAQQLSDAVKRAINVENTKGVAGVDDFQILSGLPNEIAQAWLTEACKPAPNYPIGESPPQPQRVKDPNSTPPKAVTPQPMPAQPNQNIGDTPPTGCAVSFQ